MSNLESLQRYLLLIKKVRTTPYCTKAELIQYLDDQLDISNDKIRVPSDRTFVRIIGEIRSFLGISIEYCRKNRGYHIPVDEEQNSIIENILEPLDLLYAMVGVERLPEYVFVEKRRSRGTEHIPAIMLAIKENKYISFLYSKFHPEVTDVKVIQSIALKESRGRWYLLGFDKSGDKLKSYGLDRISNMEMLGGVFKPKGNIDISEKYEHCFAMFTGDSAPEKIILSFDERDGHYVETMLIHPSQNLYKQSDRVIVELYMCITPDLIMELMSRSWSLTVIEPQSLKDEVNKIYREALERNS